MECFHCLLKMQSRKCKWMCHRKWVVKQQRRKPQKLLHRVVFTCYWRDRLWILERWLNCRMGLKKFMVQYNNDRQSWAGSLGRAHTWRIVGDWVHVLSLNLTKNKFTCGSKQFPIQTGTSLLRLLTLKVSLREIPKNESFVQEECNFVFPISCFVNYPSPLDPSCSPSRGRRLPRWKPPVQNTVSPVELIWFSEKHWNTKKKKTSHPLHLKTRLLVFMKESKCKIQERSPPNWSHK